MEISVNSVVEWTKLTVRDPRMASLLAKAANLPLQASIIIIVVTGLFSGLCSGLVTMILPPPVADPLSDPTETLVFEQLGPFIISGLTIFGNLTLMYFIHMIGRKMGGRGSLADIAAVSAVLQVVMAVILVGQVLIRLLVPVLYFAVIIFGAYVFLRGLGHAVNVGHDYDDLGTSAGVIVLSLVASVLVASFMVAILGIGPELAVEGSGL